MPGKFVPMRTRLERHRRIENECWVWTGSQDGASGYGRIRFHTPIYKGTKQVHRVAYEEYVGPIPDGLTIDHLCLVKLCFNPQHLELVTHEENIARSWITNPRRFPPTCPQGHSDFSIKKSGWRSCKECARQYSRNYYKERKDS